MAVLEVSQRHADDVAALHRVVARPTDRPDLLLAEHLAVGCRVLGTPFALVATLDGPILRVRVTYGAPPADADLSEEGDVLADGRVAVVLEREATVAHLGGGGDAVGHDLLGGGALVGSPVWADGEVVGAVLFVADGPRLEPYTPWQLAVVDLVADGVGRHLELAAGAADRQQRASRTQALLDLVPDRLYRLDRAGRVLDDAGLPGGVLDPAHPDNGGRRPSAAVVERVARAVARALDAGSVSTEVFADGSGSGEERYEARFVPAGPDEVLCIVRDVTDRHRAERALAEQVAFEALAASISTRLIGAPIDETDAVIVAALGEVARFFDADIAQLDRLVTGTSEVRVAHEWRRPGVPPRPNGGEAAELAALSWMRDQLDAAGDVLVRSLDDLPATAVAERQAMAANGIRAVQLIRLGEEHEPVGVVALMWRHRSPAASAEVLGLVRFVGEALLGAARRRDVAGLASGQSRVFELIARGAPLAETLEAVCHLLEDGDEPISVAALAVVDEGRSLALAAAPSLDEEQQRMLDGLTIGSTSPAGMAVATGRTVRVDDVEVDSRFPEVRAVAGRLGVRSVLAVPVDAPRSGTTVAVLVGLGHQAAIADRIEPGRLESCTALVAVAVERANEEARLAYQATHDALTRVANRATLLDRLTIALARSRRNGRSVAVLFCDLDRFKAINDRYGHDVGDQLLVEVADRIGKTLRPSDTVSRLGGDEFVVLCDDLVDPGQAMLVAERVGRAVESVVIRADGDEIGVTASIGVAVSTDEVENPEVLLRDADMAMYRAKTQGRARRELFAEGVSEDPLPAELLRAMEGGELRLDLQPVVGFDGVLVGVEALIRWDDPDRGALLPDRILPAAERGGVVTDLGRWVVVQALAQHGLWQEADHRFAGVPVHVNLTARDLAAPGFVEQVAEALQRAGAPASSLVVEVAEGALAALVDSPVFEELQRIGVKVVVDGFGAGGGPLAALPGLRVHGIKLDRSLVRVLDQDPGALEVAQALVGLAHGLALRALAVGVENDEQLARLRAVGCDGLQGDLVSPPVRPEQVVDGLGALLADG